MKTLDKTFTVGPHTVDASMHSLEGMWHVHCSLVVFDGDEDIDDITVLKWSGKNRKEALALYNDPDLTVEKLDKVRARYDKRMMAKKGN